MVRRILAGCFLLTTVSVAIASCSSTDTNGGSTGEGGQGGEPEQDGETPQDVTSGDALADEAAAPDTGPSKCPEGSWGTIPDSNCHLITQDCPLGQTCTPETVNGELGTRCRSSNNGLKTRGDPCVANNDCAAGLKCIFNYCAPFCCKEAEFEICGPGGQCNVNNNVSTGFVTMCSYLKPCTLWKQECPTGQGCHVIAKDGAGSCVPPSGSDFVPEGSPCQYANDCGDNQFCNAAACHYLCNLGGGPIDTGDAGAGLGGCPAGQICKALGGYPSWLGVCVALPPSDAGSD
jgi:hypothetical protein